MNNKRRNVCISTKSIVEILHRLCIIFYEFQIFRKNQLNLALRKFLFISVRFANEENVEKRWILHRLAANAMKLSEYLDDRKNGKLSWECECEYGTLVLTPALVLTATWHFCKNARWRDLFYFFIDQSTRFMNEWDSCIKQTMTRFNLS